MAVFSLAHLHAHQGRSADAYPEGNASHHGHHRAADAGSRQGDASHVGDVSYIHTVHNAVKDADELGQHTGDGNAPHKLFYIVTTEIIFQGHFLFLRKFCYNTLRTQRAGKGVCRGRLRRHHSIYYTDSVECQPGEKEAL